MRLFPSACADGRHRACAMARNGRMRPFQAGPHAALPTGRMRPVFRRRMRLRTPRACAGGTAKRIDSLRAMRRTALYDRHVAAGAKMVEFAGWEMPVQYTGVRAEHMAVREGCGIFDVSHM